MKEKGKEKKMLETNHKNNIKLAKRRRILIMRMCSYGM